MRQAYQAFAVEEPAPKTAFPAKLTGYVFLTCTVAASGGILFGYDGGVTGGIIVMEPFAQEFFPKTVGIADTNFYCKYDEKLLQTFASIMHFTGALAAFPAGYFTAKYGRTRSMTIAGVAFLIGCVWQVAAKKHVALLLVGRVFWGVGVGFADQSVTIYNAEMAPPQWRGLLHILFQLATVTGILFAQLINIGTFGIRPWGWRLSLGLAAVPGSILLLGGLFLPDSPNSLIERGQFEKGREVLEHIRGTQQVEEEYSTILAAQEAEKRSGSPWVAIFSREYRAQLVLAIAMPFFQMATGINAVVFFSPQLFGGIGSFGEGAKGGLIASAVIGTVQVVATLVGVVIIDRIGRRAVLIQASIQGCLAEIALAGLLATSASDTSTQMSHSASVAAIVLVCVFIASLGWGWGPLGWLVPSEIQPLNTRSAGQSITTFVQLTGGATVGQTFLSMLCSMKYGVFLFFGLWHILAGLFV